MRIHFFLRSLRVLAVVFFIFSAIVTTQAQGAKKVNPESVHDSDADHLKERNAWFFRGRLVPGKASAELRRRAYNAKVGMRARPSSALVGPAKAQAVIPSSSWIALGPAPLASDASGNGLQDYRQVAGRATAIAIDPADPTGNTIFVGGAQSGIWKSTNAANAVADDVTWMPISDDQATLSIGAIAIQPGNSDPSKSVILAATGEANNSGDSYFGLGILRSADGGSTWSLISTANGGALSFDGLGGTRMAFGTSAAQRNVVVAAMATTSEGITEGQITSTTARGLYSSLDAGLTWTYDALTDPGGVVDGTSATSVVYNGTSGKFYAAVRYHGFYSSPDGVNWTRLASQPGGSLLSTAACPPQSTSNNQSCPMYRGEITVVPGRNEMYAWYISVDSNGNPVDQFLWKSIDGGSTWLQISDAGITTCGDFDGCGVEQGAYNLELLAVPNFSGTDLYAGAVNLFKCSINSQNTSCLAAPFLNLTHVYGCDPIGAPAHVHPDQHALAFVIPSSGTDSGNALMYFANDGGIYRALDGFNGLNSGSCSGTNLFDDLNQNLGSMTQFVSFSQHPTDANTLLGGTQDNGSPATGQGTTSLAWGNVLGGDGGYNAIDPDSPLNFYASNPDIAPGGLGVQMCLSGIACVNSSFEFIATSDSLGGDDGAFYFPYILDPQSTTAMLIGTCRIWRGARTGGAFTALSPNFETLGSGACSGAEVNQVRAIAAGGPTNSNGSQVIYATTSGLGPVDGAGSTTAGGHVWVTTNATLGIAGFTDVTNNGPRGSINPNQFPVSSVAIDASDASGSSAYVTIMGFTGGPGHIWKTSNAGVNWTDFTANLPDSPVNAVLVDGASSAVFVATDVGVFASSTSSPSWVEVGPNAASNQTGYLPNVAVTALGLFNSGGKKLLRASTYGRGVWQYDLLALPDYQIAVTNSPQTVFAGQTAIFNGTASALNGYSSSVSLNCSAGATAPPATCSVTPASVTPGNNTPITISAGGANGDYNFDVQGLGSDANHLTHQTPLVLHIVSFGLTAPLPASQNVPRGTTGVPVDFQVTAAGSFDQSVTVSCSVAIAGAACALAPGTSVTPTASSPVNMSATVTVPATATPGSYQVNIQATTAGTSAVQTVSFTVVVTANPDFALSEPSAFPEVNAGSTGTTGTISVTAQDGFTGTVALSCPTTYGPGSCSISPASVSSFPATATLTINGTSFSAGSYSLSIGGNSGATIHSINVPFNVGDYSISGTAALSTAPGGQGVATLTFTSLDLYSGKINATCDVSSLSGAQCLLSPNPVVVASGQTASLTANINVPNNAAAGKYGINIKTQDTTGAPSHAFSITVTVAEDFRLTSSTASQTVTAGQTTGAYNLTIQPVGTSFDSAVTLTCSGLPALSNCSFNPSSPVTPGNSAVDVVMTISTTAATTSAWRQGGPAGLFYSVVLLPTLILVAVKRSAPRNRTMLRSASASVAVLLILFLVSCSGVSSGGGGGHPGTPPGTYSVKITGSSSGTPADAGQNTQVILVVN